MKSGEKDKMPKSSWTMFRNRLFINKKWYNRGLIVVSNLRPEEEQKNEIEVSQARTLNFNLESEESIDSVDTIMNESSSSSDDIVPPTVLPQNIKKVSFLLDGLIKNANLKTSALKLKTSRKIIFTNPKQDNEVFVPLVISTEENDQIGFYVYPWITGDIDAVPVSNLACDSSSSSSSSSHLDQKSSESELEIFNLSELDQRQNKIFSSINFEEFQGIKKFVTAGCLFGTALQAVDKKGATFPIIQHKIPFMQGEKIVSLIVDEEPHPYEQGQFSSLEKIALLIEALTQQDQPKKLLYHLPDYDYILYGIKLFVQDRMTYDVLNQFFYAVVNRANRHRSMIREICEKHGVDVEIKSPFSNLFGEIENIKNIDDVLRILDLSLFSEAVKLTDRGDKKQSINYKKVENDLVVRILSLLKECNFLPEHKDVWTDFINISKGKNKINNLESLFKVANAVMIGLVAKGSGNCETCSLLPSNEKPIAVKYAHYQKLFNTESAGSYQNVVALTFIEQVIAYSHFAPGNTFYFRPNEKELVDLNKVVLEGATHNLGLFATGNKPRSKIKHLIDMDPQSNSPRL